MLCGLPFAGKTTLARTLVARYGWRAISLDAINGERGLGLAGDPSPPHEWDQTYAEAYRRVSAALGAGETVIYDETNFLKTQRDSLRAIAAACHLPAYVIYLQVSAAEARRRWQQNRLLPQRNDVRDDDFANVVARFEPPIADERVICYDPTLPLDEWMMYTFEADGSPRILDAE